MLNNFSIFTCHQCGEQIKGLMTFKMHRTSCRPDTIPSIPITILNNIERVEVTSALNNSVRGVRLTPLIPFPQPREFLQDAREIIEDTIDILLKECTECKINMNLCVQISKIQPEDDAPIETGYHYFSVESHTLDDLFLTDIYNELESRVANFMNKGSNWQIDGVKYLEMNVTRYRSLRQVAGRSNRTAIPLPKSLSSKKGIINVYNDGPDCFRYALLSILHYNEIQHHRNRPSKYSHWLNEHNWQGRLIYFVYVCVCLHNLSILFVCIFRYNVADDKSTATSLREK